MKKSSVYERINNFEYVDSVAIVLFVKIAIVFIHGNLFLQKVVPAIKAGFSFNWQFDEFMNKLKEALSKVRTLSGFLPICASCKKIRDDKGYWNRIEEYIEQHSEAEFSHGMCPDCFKERFPDDYGAINDRNDNEQNK